MNLKGVVYVVISALLFGFTPIISSYTFEMGNNALSLTFYRNLFVLPILFLLTIKSGESIKLEKIQFLKLLPIGILGVATTTLLLYSSYDYVGVGVATTIHFMYPVFVALICKLFFKDKLGIVKILVLILASVGVCFFLEGDMSGQIAGLVMSLISAITYAYYIVAVEKQGLKNINPYKLTFYFALCSSITMLVYNLFTKEIVWNLSGKVYLMIFIVAIGTSFLGVMLLQLGIKELGASTASILCMFEPISSVLFGVLLLGEKMTVNKIIGNVLVLSAVIVLVVYDKKKA